LTRIRKISPSGKSAAQGLETAEETFLPGRGLINRKVPHIKIESTVRYLKIEVDDALAIAEQIDV
jgi:hypothetical protein